MNQRISSRAFWGSTLAILLALSCPVRAAEPERPLRFIFLTPFADYGYFKTVKQGMNDAARGLGVKAVFSGPADGNLAALSEQVRRAVQDGYDGIAINLVDPVALDSAVADAVKKGVPVIAFNVDDHRTPNARLAAIGQDMPRAGRKFGEAVAPFISNGSHVLLTMHDPGISALEERAAGALEVLKGRNLVVTNLITGTDPERARQKIREALEAHPSIKTILSTGSADTEAAGLVVEKDHAGQGYLAAGFDLSPEILRLVKSGVIRLTVDQQPYAQGYYAVAELTLLKRYGLAPPSIDTGAAIIDAAQAETVMDLSRQNYR